MSQWGHDFRPESVSYTHLMCIRDRIKMLSLAPERLVQPLSLIHI
nr:hypothetical protein [Pseudomonas sp. HS-2]